jgi:nitrogen-specific signal transduction histidine kinase
MKGRKRTWYEPQVEMGTRQKRQCGVEVRDNGTGIPEKIRIRSFNPSSPRNQLARWWSGLSLSYDIVNRMAEKYVSSTETENGVHD